jgi:adenosine deaminase
MKVTFGLFFLLISTYLYASLPVSELHVHADAGILTESLFIKLAKKNHLNIKVDGFYKQGVIYHKPGDFLDFLHVYDLVSSVIQTPQDITELVYDYLKRSSQQGAIYTELMISPDHFDKKTAIFNQENRHENTVQKSTLSYQVVVGAVAKAINNARHDVGIESRIVIVILRHKGVKAANILLNKIIHHPHPYVRGITLAGDDINYPASLFKDVYQKAKQHGLYLSAHMGEHTGPKDIQLAMEMQLDRIGHGLSVVDNKKIMAAFKQSDIGIEVCPSSNIDNGHGKFESLKEHPLKKMIDNHLYVSISTDDPAFLQTNIQAEYLLVQKAYKLTHDQMIELCKNSIKMSFAEPALKRQLLLKINQYKQKG